MKNLIEQAKEMRKVIEISNQCIEEHNEKMKFIIDSASQLLKTLTPYGSRMDGNVKYATSERSQPIIKELFKLLEGPPEVTK